MVCLAVLLAAHAAVAAPQAGTFEEFGFAFLRTADPGTNAVAAPRNLGRLLALVATGAKGKTQDEMLAALRKTRADVEGLGKAAPACGQKEAWAVAGAVSFTDAFQKRLDDLEADRIPFSSNREETRRAIDEWARARTRGEIRDLVPKGGLDDRSALVLAAVSEFSSRWQQEFEVRNTKMSQFQLPSGEKVNIPMMYGRKNARVAFLPEVSILELPFQCEGLAAMVLLPPPASKPTGADRKEAPAKTPTPGPVPGLEMLEKMLSRENLSRWKEQLRHDEVRVELPTFEVRHSWNANRALQRLGIRRAFASGADFTGMAATPLFVQQAFHQAVVKVGEGGVDAWAGSAVVFGSRAAVIPPPAPKFEVDRPFIFLIQDVRSGEVLFLARVVDPRSPKA